MSATKILTVTTNKATAQMRLFSAADQGLSEKHLVEQNHDPKLTTKKRAEVPSRFVLELILA